MRGENLRVHSNDPIDAAQPGYWLIHHQEEDDQIQLSIHSTHPDDSRRRLCARAHADTDTNRCASARTIF